MQPADARREISMLNAEEAIDVVWGGGSFSSQILLWILIANGQDQDFLKFFAARVCLVGAI